MSLVPTFSGKKIKDDRQFFWYFPDDRLHWGQRSNAAVFDQKTQMKYIMFFNGDEDEMYNIDSDLEERSNILSEQPELALRLQTSLIKFLKNNFTEAYPPPVKFQQNIKARLGIKP